MKPESLKRIDAVAAGTLLLWAGAALGFAVLTAPKLFSLLPRDTAANVAGALVGGLDLGALLAFGTALLLAGGARWLAEIEDALPIGPLRLWTAAAFMALVMSALSAFLIAPRIRELRAAHQGLVSTLPDTHPDRKALLRNHQLSTLAFFLRMVLAAGLAWGVGKLPTVREETP